MLPLVLRLVVVEEVLRLVLALELPVDRLERVFWSTLPAEREVEEPVLRLVVALEVLPVERLVVAAEELPEERLVVLPLVERLLEPVLRVRSFCAKEERLAEDPVLRLIEGLVERLLETLAERLVEGAEERLIDMLAERLLEPPEEREVDTEPDERLIEEDPRVVVWEEDDRDAAEDPPERRDWATASGAAIITKVMSIAAKVLIILFMAL